MHNGVYGEIARPYFISIVLFFLKKNLSSDSFFFIFLLYDISCCWLMTSLVYNLLMAEFFFVWQKVIIIIYCPKFLKYFVHFGTLHSIVINLVKRVFFGIFLLLWLRRVCLWRRVSVNNVVIHCHDNLFAFLLLPCVLVFITMDFTVSAYYTRISWSITRRRLERPLQSMMQFGFRIKKGAYCT